MYSKEDISDTLLYISPGTSVCKVCSNHVLSLFEHLFNLLTFQATSYTPIINVFLADSFAVLSKIDYRFC